MASQNKDLHPVVQKLRFEHTFAMVKPDGVMRGLVGDIVSRFERAGLKIVAMKMLTPTKEHALKHYPVSDEAWVERLGEKTYMGLAELEGVSALELFGTEDKRELGQGVVDGLIEYLQSGPVVCMVVEGVQAISMVRKLAGHTLPFKAEVGTIRGDYSIDTPAIANAQGRPIHNVLHASETASEAENEIKLWFGDEKINSYAMNSEFMMYAKYY
jgi:nucleoside-diphosphate kinase